MTTAHVHVLASRVRLEEKLLLEALRGRGMAPQLIDPRSLGGSVGGISLTDPHDPHRKTVDDTDVPLVINREIGQARAYYGASLLELSGAHVVNTAEATRLCGDKWLTSAALVRAGLPTPTTSLALTPDAATETLRDLGTPAVLKPLIGSWGRLVTRIDDEAAAAPLFEHVGALPSPQSHVVYLQRLVADAVRDLRVIVVGGRAIGAICRSADTWRANVARGGTATQATLTDEIATLAVATAACVGADISGVDLLESADGRLTVIEVNDRVEFRGFQAAHGARVDVAAAIADHVLAARPPARPNAPAVPDVLSLEEAS